MSVCPALPDSNRQEMEDERRKGVKKNQEIIKTYQWTMSTRPCAFNDAICESRREGEARKREEECPTRGIVRRGMIHVHSLPHQFPFQMNTEMAVVGLVLRDSDYVWNIRSYP